MTPKEAGRKPAAGYSAWLWLAVAAAVSWNLWQLRSTLLPVAYGNDNAMHEQMVRFATARLRAGHDPLTSWFPYLGLGSPHFLHYQSVPAILTGLAGLVVGPDPAFRWSLYLLWCLWPIAVYCSARILGLGKAAAALAGLVSPLLSSATGIGYERHGYVFTGFGVWTQLWGSWALPFAWALSWRAMADKRFIAPAAAVVAVTAALHFETGYLAFLAIVIMPFVIAGDIAARLGRASALLAAALLASVSVIVPLLRYSRWAAINQALAAGPSASGYGAGTTLRWLVTGQVLDYRHWPVISLLAAAGLAIALWRWRRADPGRVLVVLLCAGLVLSFGRTTFGSAAAVLPGSSDVFFRRFLMGAQLAAIYLAGIGAAQIAELGARLCASCTRALRARRLAWLSWLPVTALTLAGLAYLSPAWRYLDSFDAANAENISVQRQAQAAAERPTTAVLAVIRRHGAGRAYAGTPANWGEFFTIGLVPMYQVLDNADVDEVGYTLRTASLMSQPEYHFDPGDAGDYALLGIRYVILPATQAPPPPRGAVLVLRDSSFKVFELPTSSYFSVGDTVGSIAANRSNIGSRTASYLRSAQPGQGRYLTVAYAGARPAPDTGPAVSRPGKPDASRPGGPAGRVLAEHLDLASGRASTTVWLRRRAIVVLSASFDPGWSAFVDGHPATTEMIAPALVAVAVPPGRHHVTFRYTGFSGYPELLILTVADLVAVAGLTLRPPRRARRDPSLLGGESW